VRAYRRAVDRAVDALAGAHFPTPAPITVLATGGYGRGELAFASDIDLLLLHSGPEPAEETAPFLTALWDMDWDLGHQVLPVDDALELAGRDTHTLTSFLEARLLWGAEELFRTFTAALHREVFEPRREAWAAEKVSDLESRHAQAGETVYLAEPDVKESPGGLRDMHTLLWLSRARSGPVLWPAYLARHAVPGREYERLLGARDHSLWVRNVLHLHRGRKWDRLDHRSQQEVARETGAVGRRGRLGVEIFMQEYYRAVWSIFTFTRLQLAAHGHSSDRPRNGLPRVLAPAGAGGQQWSADEIATVPLNLLRRLLDLTRHGGRLGPETAEFLYTQGEFLGTAAAREAGHGPLLMALLSEPRAAATLRLMHDFGILGGLLSEFDRLRALVQFDPYHSFTADEHTLRALDALEALLEPGGGSIRSELCHDLPAVRAMLPLDEWMPERRDTALLRLALLYHDIAKGTGIGGHAERGARMVRRAGRRIGLAEAELRDVAFLVRHHLLLSATAQRRDISEPVLIERLCRLVRTPRRLHLLALLTLCDTAALGPNVLTRWKARLLLELVGTVERALRGEQALHRCERVERLLASLPASERESLGVWLDAMPPEYLPDLDPAILHREAALFEVWRADPAGRDAVAFQLGSDRETSRLTCIAGDRPGLLGRLCGLLAGHDITILQARIFTRLDGIIVDRFTVADAAAGGPLTDGQKKALDASLAAAVTGRLDVEALLADHAERWRLRDRPTMTHAVSVSWDLSASRRYSVFELRTRDRVGLLHDVAMTMTGRGISIHQAFISTEAERAVDAFYVTDPLGAPLDDATREVLRADLIGLLTD